MRRANARTLYKGNFATTAERAIGIWLKKIQMAVKVSKPWLAYTLFWCTLGGITSICFRFYFQQTLRMHTQGCQGCQKTRNFVRNSKILIARSTIQPKLSKIKNHYEIHVNSLKNLNFSQNFWSFDTPDTPGCASAVAWNCLKQIWAIPPTVRL